MTGTARTGKKFRFGIPVFRNGIPTSRSFLAIVVVLLAVVGASPRPGAVLAEARGLPAAFRLARILVQQRLFEEAKPILEPVIATNPRNGEAWLAMARARRGQDRRDEAVAALLRALAEGPALNEARFGLAQLLTREGEREAVAPLFVEFERRKASADESRRLLGEAELHPDNYGRVEAFVPPALANGDFGLALRGAQRSLVEFPEDAERHLLLARVFRKGGAAMPMQTGAPAGTSAVRRDEEAERRFEAGLRAIGVR